MSIQNLLSIADQIADIDPILAFELEKNAKLAINEFDSEPGEFTEKLFKSKDEPDNSVQSDICEQNESMDKIPSIQNISFKDESVALKNVKDLLNAAGPLLVNGRSTTSSIKILPVLVRTAHIVPRSRSVLMPVIRRIISASK